MPNHLVWTPACDAAFTALKTRLCLSPVLWIPDLGRPFVLQMDTSNRGVGMVLSQLDDDGTEYPVAYYSRKLLPLEEWYVTVEKERVSIKLAVHVFKVYLVGKHFTIQNDHHVLVWLDQLKDSNAQ